MKKFHLWSVVLGIVLLALLIWNIGPRVLWHDLNQLGWGLLPLILIEGIADVFHTLGWRHCLSKRHRSMSFLQLYCIRMAGFSINYLTPTAALGGEVIKGALLSLTHRGPQAVTAVVIGKLSYALSQLILIVVGSVIIVWTVRMPPVILSALLFGSILLGVGIVIFLFVQRHGKLGSILRWIVAHNIGGNKIGKKLRGIAHHVNNVDRELQLFYKKHPMDLPYSVCWHIVGMSCGILQSWYFLYLLSDHHTLLIAASVWFLSGWFDLLSFAVPSNIGVLEGTRIIAFRLVGFTPALGLAYGIALRLEQIFWAGVGLLIYGVFMLFSLKKEGGLVKT